ncbi:hypothetical protein Pmani_017173 [Petrolisthes manimaculis]|uniref:C2H2-type domain-containing protein n=1 Tax=Petrolisthes manimaculis TaxID=1843537 RepID=A0AAE1U9Q2_9EUCA|nr:hypothetical protein Pmani_017173 [Petrolisthes manimaculis]
MDDSVVRVTEMKDEETHNASVVVVEENGGAVRVELPDGTQAIVHNAISEEPQDLEGVAIQLDCGRIGYLYSDTLLQAVADEPDPFLNKYPCCFPNCNKSYSTVNHLRTHQRNHTGQRPHVCAVCNKRFTTGYALKSHVRTHTGEKPYQCPEEQCGKSFKTSSDLQKHVRTHTGERPFKCNVCSKSFTTSNIRKVHMRVHTGEKPYECQHEGCGRRFASATNFRNHCRIHTGEKPYVCSIENCGRRFTEYSSLYKHHMVHYQQKRYCCSLCGRYYRQLSTLAVHKRTVHNITEGDDESVVWINEGLLKQEWFSATGNNCNGGGVEGNATSAANVTTTTTIVSAPGTSHSTTGTVHLPTRLVVKKEPQLLPGTLLNADLTMSEDDGTCIQVPGVEVGNLMSEDGVAGDSVVMTTDDHSAALTGLELDGSGNGSIFVFTDTSQLEALQLAVAEGGGGDNRVMDDTVEVIRLEDLASVTHSVEEADLSKGGDNPAPVSSHPLIIHFVVNQKSSETYKKDAEKAIQKKKC